MSILINYATSIYNKGFVNLCVPAAAGSLLTPAMTIIHELGHVLAFKILYRNAHPKITLKHYGIEGDTDPNFSGVPQLSLIGRVLRQDRVDMIVSAAGPITEMVAKLAVINGFNFSIRYPLLIWSSIDSAIYAYDPLIESNNSDDDFQVIKRISPIFYKTLLGASAGLATYIFAKAVGNCMA